MHTCVWDVQLTISCSQRLISLIFNNFVYGILHDWRRYIIYFPCSFYWTYNCALYFDNPYLCIYKVIIKCVCLKIYFICYFHFDYSQLTVRILSTLFEKCEKWVYLHRGTAVQYFSRKFYVSVWISCTNQC